MRPRATLTGMRSRPELESIQGVLKRFPSPVMPREGGFVFVRFEVDPEGELSETVGSVTAQRFSHMTIQISYFSAKQEKVVQEPVELEREGAVWVDKEIDAECVLTEIKKGDFDSWLEKDEKKQRAKPSTEKKSLQKSEGK